MRDVVEGDDEEWGAATAQRTLRRYARTPGQDRDMYELSH
jgi:hypothetical protein